MKPTRSILLLVSVVLVLFLLVGGLAVRVGAGESTYHQVVLFSEILSLVMENYVDPVEAEKLIGGAFEGMLGGLDANGAFLTPAEVREWKAGSGRELAQPGVSVLKAGRALQVVSVVPDSPAEAAGVLIGDHIRAVNGVSVRDLSLSQAWRLILGEPGTTLKLDLLHPADGFRREQIEVARARRPGPTYELKAERGIAVMQIHDLGRLPVSDVAEELDDLRSRGVETLLLDLRNAVDLDPRGVAPAAGLFSTGTLLNLRDRSGRLVESLESSSPSAAWPGAVAILVNGATAGSAEALAILLQSDRDGIVLGEPTYGLGAEAKLYELENGSGLLVSAALWETVSGKRWNREGVQPDEVIRGKGDDYAAMAADQLRQALDRLEPLQPTPAVEREAA